MRTTPATNHPYQVHTDPQVKRNKKGWYGRSRNKPPVSGTSRSTGKNKEMKRLVRTHAANHHTYRVHPDPKKTKKDGTDTCRKPPRITKKTGWLSILL
jgi:hypothetical protein